MIIDLSLLETELFFVLLTEQSNGLNRSIPCLSEAMHRYKKSNQLLREQYNSSPISYSVTIVDLFSKFSYSD